MNKKEYMKPALRIVRIEHQGIICTSVTGTTNNVNMIYGGGGSGPSRARSFDGWDDEE